MLRDGRRLPVHASRIQRARRARHLARRGPRAARAARRRSTRARAVDVTHSEETWHELLKPAAGKQGDALVRTRVRQHLPDRLADWLMRDAGVTPDQPVATLTRDVRRRLVERLTSVCAALDVRRGLSQGGSDRRRRGAGRGAAEDAGEPASSGAVPVRRDAGCVRPDRRPQLRVGLGHRPPRGPRRGGGPRDPAPTSRRRDGRWTITATMSRSGRISIKERFHHGLDGLPQAAADRHHRMDR